VPRNEERGNHRKGSIELWVVVGGGEWVKNWRSDKATFAFDSIAIERYLELVLGL
jgi:hypothetical protein